MRYAVRIIEANKSLAFVSKAENIMELKKAIASSPSPFLVLDTEEFGPAIIHRDHIIIITKEDDDDA